MKTWLWIHSIPYSQQILLCYLYLNTNQLQQQILKLVGQEAGPAVKCPKLQRLNIQTKLLIYHVNLDQRKLLFLNRLYLHQIRRREVLL